MFGQSLPWTNRAGAVGALVVFSSVTLAATVSGCRDELPTALERGLVITSPLVNLPVTPNDGGVISSPVVTIANGPAGEFEPRVSGDGDLVCYSDASLSGPLRYWRFSTGVSNNVPEGGGQCAVDGSRIVSVRSIPDGEDSYGSRSAIVLFDVSTSSGMELDPQIGSSRSQPAIGNNTVAFRDDIGSESGIRTVEPFFFSNPQSVISEERSFHSSPNVSPGGNVVVWQRCAAPSGDYCEVWKATRTTLPWSIPEAVGEEDEETQPDTDGAYVAYVGRFDAGEEAQTDILFQAVSGGPVVQLTIPGNQGRPRINHRVISFITRLFDPTTGSSQLSAYMYVIATNKLYKIDATAGAENNDFAILPNGEVRMVWDVPGESQIVAADVFATTFRLPGSFSFGGFLAPINNPPTVNVARAGAAIPVKFGLGADHGLNIFASGSPSSVAVTCNAGATTGTVDETVTAGNSTLTYDATSDTYSYIWKTDKAWANTCRRLSLQFVAGTVATAEFQFSR